MEGSQKLPLLMRLVLPIPENTIIAVVKEKPTFHKPFTT